MDPEIMQLLMECRQILAEMKVSTQRLAEKYQEYKQSETQMEESEEDLLSESSIAAQEKKMEVSIEDESQELKKAKIESEDISASASDEQKTEVVVDADSSSDHQWLDQPLAVVAPADSSHTSRLTLGLLQEHSIPGMYPLDNISNLNFYFLPLSCSHFFPHKALKNGGEASTLHLLPYLLPYNQTSATTLINYSKTPQPSVTLSTLSNFSFSLPSFISDKSSFSLLQFLLGNLSWKSTSTVTVISTPLSSKRLNTASWLKMPPWLHHFPYFTKCLSSVWQSKDRYIWVNLAAGPVDYGPGLSGDGLLLRGEFHLLAAFNGKPKLEKEVLADLAPLVYSAYQVLLVPSLRIPILDDISRKNSSFVAYVGVFHENNRIDSDDKLGFMKLDLNDCKAALVGCCFTLESVEDAERVIELLSLLRVSPDEVSVTKKLKRLETDLELLLIVFYPADYVIGGKWGTNSEWGLILEREKSAYKVFNEMPQRASRYVFLLLEICLTMETKRSVLTLKGKRAFVRIDLNVPLDDNSNITDNTRSRAAVSPIKYLIGYGAKVILCNHLGCPKSVSPKYSLKSLVPRLSELHGIEVKMANDSIGEEMEILVAALPEGGVLLLEHVRFYKEEDKNEPEFASHCPSAGSACYYSYVYVGEGVAWLVGWSLMLEYTIGGFAIACGISPNLVLLLGSSDRMPTFLNRQYIPALDIVDETCAAIFIVKVTGLLCLGIKESAFAQAVVTSGNVCAMPFVLVIAGGYLGFKTGWASYDVPTGYFSFGINGVFVGSVTVFFFHIGFDVARAAGEVKNPKRDLPLGIAFSLLICCALYMLVSVVVVGLIPYYELDPDTPISFAFSTQGMQWAAYIILIGASTALCSSLLGSFLPSSLQVSTCVASLVYSGILEDVDGENSGKHVGISKAEILTLIHYGNLSAGHPLILKQSVECTNLHDEKRRKIADWTITLTCIGAFLVVVAASCVGLPSTPRFILCAVGVALLISTLIVLSCINQYEARYSQGHTGGFICPLIPLLPIASIIINTYLLVNLGVAT